jgi:hypothetical protein
MSVPDARQRKLLEPYADLTPNDLMHFHELASDVNILRRVQKAMDEGHIATPSFIPAFYEDKTFQEVIQWLAFYAIRGYMSENQKPPTLLDIYYRVREKVYSAIREGAWPKKWPAPSKRTVDRRVNEIASNKPKENLIMDKGCPRVIATKAGEYSPNPALYEDVAKILEGSTQ